MKTIFVVAAHPDDEVLGCGGTLLKHDHDGDKVYILFISDGVSGRFKEKDSDKCLKEISNREIMARKVSSLGKFKIVDFLNLKNLELSSYPHNYITNIIVKYFKKYKPDIVYTHYEHDLNIDHYQTFFSTHVAVDQIMIFKLKNYLVLKFHHQLTGELRVMEDYFVLTILLIFINLQKKRKIT